MAGNRLQIPEGGDYEAQILNIKMNINRSTKAQLTTKPPLLGRCCYVQSFIDVLSKKVNLVRCNNNHKIYISKECPFCGEKGRRVFRYNSKLKVGKSYCCGASFKDISWLRKRLENGFDFDKYQLYNKQGWYKYLADEKIMEYKKFFEDKLSMKESGFEKSNEEDLPF